MSATLSIINSFSIPIGGNTFTGKQGLVADAIGDNYDITVAGDAHIVPGTLATATAVTLFDDDDDVPIDWDYLYLWASGICYLQLIAGSTSVVHKIAAYQPFVLPGYDSMLPAASATPITGGSEPSLTDIDSAVLGNYSGASINFLFAVID